MSDPLDLVAPDLRDVIALLPDLSNLENRLSEVRQTIGGQPAPLGQDGDVMVSRLDIARSDGGAVSALFYHPVSPTGPVPALLHIHGGGYVAGSAQRDHDEARKAASLGCAVLVPDYRLAPEHPYPAALDDCMACLAWLRSALPPQAIDPQKLVVRGISAGGGIAMALALRNRDENAPTLAGLHLVYPMLDDRTVAHPHNGRFVWTIDANNFGWNSYLRGQDRSAPPPYAVPARVGSVAGLPPVFLATGSLDLFAGENLALAQRLIDAGNALELHVYPGAYHGFALVGSSRSAQQYSQDSIRALERTFFPASQKDKP